MMGDVRASARHPDVSMPTEQAVEIEVEGEAMTWWRKESPVSLCLPGYRAEETKVDECQSKSTVPDRAPGVIQSSDKWRYRDSKAVEDEDR